MRSRCHRPRSRVVDWYLPQPRAVRGDLRSDRSGGVLLAADRAAQSDRVLRGAPAGVQRHLRFCAAGSAARPWTRGSRSCSSAASIPTASDAAVPRSGAVTAWPSRDEVSRFARAPCDDRRRSRDAPLRDDRPAMQRAQALYTALEHEAMHQETLLYMWHRLPYDAEATTGQTVAAPSRASGRTIVEPRARRETEFAFPPAPRRSAPTATTSRSAGTTSSTRTASTSRRSRSTSHRHQRASTSSSSRLAATATRVAVGRRGLGVDSAETSVDAPGLLGSADGPATSGPGAGCSRTFRCRRLAGLRQPGGSVA